MKVNFPIFGKHVSSDTAMASAYIQRIKGKTKTDIYLHPIKCIYCKGYEDNVEEQIIVSINHEVQESLIVEILYDEKGYYRNDWYDRAVEREHIQIHTHKCSGWWKYIIPRNKSDSGTHF